MSQKKSKKELKIKKQKEEEVDPILKSLSEFADEIISDDTDDDKSFGFPYRIPYKHKGLQKATGGVIGGTMKEISGESQAGKSFLLYELIASVQEMGGWARLTDCERAFEKAYGISAGIDMKSGRFLLSRNNNMSNFFQSNTAFINRIREAEKAKKVPREKWAPILIACDSFPGLQHPVDLSNFENEKEARGYAAMQKNALLSQNIDKFVSFLSDNDATFVLLNQVRKNHAIQYGDKTVTPAEDVIKFWCTQRLRGKLSKKLVKKTKSLEFKTGGKQVIGGTTVWESIKNRSVRPFQKVSAKFTYAGGMALYSGLDEILYSENKIVLATTKFNEDGTESKSTHKGYKIVGDETEKFYYSIESLVDANPHLLEPAWTGTEVQGEEIEEDDSGEE